MNGITREIAKMEVGRGWSKLVDAAYDAMRDDTIVLQVKEKFGGLRIYISSGTDALYDVLDNLETLSTTVCEFCGKEGKNRPIRSWYKTTCDHCYQLLLDRKFEELSSGEEE